MNYEILENEYLLLDTNILIDCSKFTPFFKDFIDKLNEHNVTLVIDQTVRFEFLRKADSVAKREVLEKFLKALLLGGIEIPFNKDTVTDAIYIANIYDWKKETKIALADCFLASAMKKFNENSAKSNLYLATQNHKDFPEYFFKRVGIETIDRTRTDIHTIGFYEFDKDIFQKTEISYLKNK